MWLAAVLQCPSVAQRDRACPNESDDNMTRFDLVNAGGRVVSADSVFEADIAVTGEAIVAIGDGLAARGDPGGGPLRAAGRDRRPCSLPRARLYP
jgi:hypothetical protein